MELHRTANDWDSLKAYWNGVHNFRMGGDCVPFSFELPPIEEIVDELRRDPEARITAGTPGPKLKLDDISATFKALPIDRALQSEFALAHFKLANFYGPGRLLHNFEARVMDPWRQALQAAGFTWDRCYPIIFISGPGCATNYHMDFSHVIAWQVYGTKRFIGLKDPDRWAPRRARVTYRPDGYEPPAGIGPDDQLSYRMDPGDVLWNVLLTPHWVETPKGIGMSINLSHGGLRLNGELSPFEAELEEWRADNE